MQSPEAVTPWARARSQQEGPGPEYREGSAGEGGWGNRRGQRRKGRRWSGSCLGVCMWGAREGAPKPSLALLGWEQGASFGTTPLKPLPPTPWAASTRTQPMDKDTFLKF